MHQAGARLRRHMVAAQQGGLALVKRMRKHQTGKRRAVCRGERPRPAQPPALHGGFAQVLRHDVALAVRLHQRVGQFRMHHNRAVCRQRPGGGRPNHRRHAAAAVRHAKARAAGSRIPRRKSHIHRHGDALLVFNLRLGKGGLAIRAPQHRLQAVRHQPLRVQPPQRADDARLSRRMHGLVRVRPLAHHPHADKPLALQVDLRFGKGAAFAAEGVRAAAVGPRLLHLMLYGQPVAVPPRQIGGVKPRQRLAAHHHILQDFVHRMANVQRAIGIGGTIMQDEFFAPRRRLPHAPVQIPLLPRAQHFRLAPRQVPAHGKGRRKQVKGIAVFRHGKGGIIAPPRFAAGGLRRAKRGAAVANERQPRKPRRGFLIPAPPRAGAER